MHINFKSDVKSTCFCAVDAFIINNFILGYDDAATKKIKSIIIADYTSQ